MDASHPVPPPTPGRRLRTAGLALAAILVTAGLVVALIVRWQPVRPKPAPAATFDTPFLNARPGVEYVGDGACIECHPGEVETYRRHPMGRSFAPVATSTPREAYDAAAHNPFERLGYRFVVERRDNETIHRTTRVDDTGQPIVAVAPVVHYAIGSGTRGRSYFLNRDGCLFQSPISWFSQSNRWDLSPGFEDLLPRERPIDVTCLFCHTNRAEAVPYTVNRFREPIFQGYAIGCERCHGPGALHVAARERGDLTTGEFDDTIVNPRHLPPPLREGVCHQCHLLGEKRLVRAGREPFDYRPGLPFHAFWAVFVRPKEFTDNHRAVGQVEQMASSRCYQGSNGKLGCISCHDPHVQPAPAERVAFYRGRCLACHEGEAAGKAGGQPLARGCSLPVATRRAQQADDSCIACHMPHASSSDIAHTAVTDHRVLRRPEPAPSAPPTPRPLQPGQVPLVNFYRDQLPPNDAEANRDLGVALAQLARENDQVRHVLGPMALPLLDAAVKQRPSDPDAWEALALSLAVGRRGKEALAAIETALAQAPGHEQALYLGSIVCEQLRRPDDAIAYLRRAHQANPHASQYRRNLATLLAQKRDWSGVRTECEAVLRVSPTDEQTRVLFITSCLRLGDRARAEKELATMIALHPKEEQVIRKWYAEMQ